MTGLAETTARLKRLRGDVSESSEGALGKMTETLVFGPNPGALRMLTYRPEGGGRGMPLVVVLHGCAQRAETFTPAGPDGLRWPIDTGSS